MKCLFCVKYLGDERHQAHINLSHHTYQEDLQYIDWDLCLKSLCAIQEVYVPGEV